MTKKIDTYQRTEAALTAVSSVVLQRDENQERKHSLSSASASVGSDYFELTHQAMRLQNLQRQLSQSPAIDAKRVQLIQTAIHNGSYQINADVIAEGICQMEHLLSD